MPVSYTHLDVYKRQGLQDRPGLAMYPLDGYTGTDLISAAKNHAASLDVLALNAPDSEAA